MATFCTLGQNPRGRWRARSRHKGGRYQAPRIFKNKRRAIAWLAEDEKLIELDAWTPPKTRNEDATPVESPTVAEWLTTYHESLRTQLKPLKESTLQNYERVTSNRITSPLPPGDQDLDIIHLAGLKITEVTIDDIHRWWEAVNRTYPSKMINQQAYKRLKAAFARAVEREIIDKNPVQIKAATAKVQTKEKYLPSDAELKAILNAMQPRYKVLTSLVLFHGLRIGEAIALERHHLIIDKTPEGVRVFARVEQNAQRLYETIDGKAHTIMHWQSPKTKAGYRDVPIMARHVPLYLQHLEDYPPVACEVAHEGGKKTIYPPTVTERGKPIVDTSYRSRLSTAETKAGVTTEIDPHCGRNWLITRLAEQGAHLKEIGKLLGQTDLNTITQVYMKVRAGRTDTLMAKVDATLT
ncbi:site-specific integrase [Corynebacterium sp. ES2715-CONJ3]|uniref:tyrosine-type recombinase/integrase n=1 Tax=Corynebacterium sp. ES2715-CONJ3 TaxID=2974028 RepID=UPI0021675DDB|nr:site-specific integrase [Corynebacterium sp. ES2715-CONJ3]MCS4492149.1 site-specific integrase [Corynebacterium sp. ES2715-CONJ3]